MPDLRPCRGDAGAWRIVALPLAALDGARSGGGDAPERLPACRRSSLATCARAPSHVTSHPQQHGRAPGEDARHEPPMSRTRPRRGASRRPGAQRSSLGPALVLRGEQLTRERLALLALDHPRQAGERLAADADAHLRVRAGCAPNAHDAGRRRGSRRARHRSRTRSRSCAAARSCARWSGGGRRRRGVRAPAARGTHAGRAGRQHRAHAAVDVGGDDLDARTGLGGHEVFDAGRRPHRQPGRRHPVPKEVEHRPEPRVAVLGAHGAVSTSTTCGSRSVTAWCSRAASL